MQNNKILLSTLLCATLIFNGSLLTVRADEEPTTESVVSEIPTETDATEIFDVEISEETHDVEAASRAGDSFDTAMRLNDRGACGFNGINNGDPASGIAKKYLAFKVLDQGSYKVHFKFGQPSYNIHGIVNPTMNYKVYATNRTTVEKSGTTRDFVLSNENGVNISNVDILFSLNPGEYYLEVEVPKGYEAVCTTITSERVTYCNQTQDGGYWDGNNYTLKGDKVINSFFCDGKYTYYLQADGTAMKNRLTYHPDGVHIIYFDANGYEVFDNYSHITTSIAGAKVDDFCYFNTFGYMYVNVLTYDATGKVIYYINPYGQMERKGWFQFSNNLKWADGTKATGYALGYGYAQYDGSLYRNAWTYKGKSRVYLQGNGVVKGSANDKKYIYTIDNAYPQQPATYRGLTGATSIGVESSWTGSDNDSGSGSGSTTPTTNPNDVTKYSYEIIPLLAPFNSYYYVKTDNPNPGYIQFVDKESKYYNADEKVSSNPCSIRPSLMRFSDVVYENYETGRVNGGYIFVRDNGYNMDGGTLVLQQANREYKSTGSYSTTYCTYTDTNVTVSCPTVCPAANYLIDTYTNSGMSFFEKLDRVEVALNELAVYPCTVADGNAAIRSYPALAASPYYELGLNTHYENIYPQAGNLLLKAMYPYVLDSLGFPNMMYSVAKKLDESCTGKAGSTHYLVEISYGGKTDTYGGAGRGSTNPIISTKVDSYFKFDGSASDYYGKYDIAAIKTKYLNYKSASDRVYSEFADKVTGTNSTFYNKTKNGTWIRIGIEGTNRSTYAYVSAVYSANSSSSLTNTWVDGRFIGIYERIEPGVKWGDTLPYGNNYSIDTTKSNILLRNITHIDRSGNTVTSDILYKYWDGIDAWVANGYSSSSASTLADELVLTRDEVQALISSGAIDGNTNTLPEHGLIYDGTAEPGTPF